MKTAVYNQEGKKIDEITLNPAIFGVEENVGLVHEVITILRGNQRIAIAHTKTRSEIRGGGKKPWRQKGTGRARHGSIRSPLWKGGGITFGPRNERNFERKINKKAKRKALYVVLSDKAREGNIKILDDLQLTDVKTKQAKQIVNTICESQKKKCLIVVSDLRYEIVMSMRNIPGIDVISAHSLNVLDVVKNQTLLVVKDALPVIEKTFLNNEKKA